MTKLMTKVFIIAEAGVNHNGSLELAKKLIDVAAHAGADAVKFQTFKADKLVCRSAKKAEYQLQSSAADESQFDMLKKLELDEAAHHEIIRYCAEKNIQFLSTPFDHDSIDLLASLGMSTFKIPSGEITNLPYLRKVGKIAKDVILSTGMANLGEVEAALMHLCAAGLRKEKITVLHATTEYPCPINEVNLRAMQTMGAAFNVKVGYSDHTPGIEVAIAAVAMGASVIEKHFTLDRTMEGPDHKASLEPQELNAMVRGIRNVSLALGDGIKQASYSEAKNIPISRKSIVTASQIKIGDVFSANNLTVKRPGNGIDPMRWDEIIGQIAQRNYAPDEQL
ncbi:N-acetylneuraminate synthase [Solimicrobium silvestre]|uniref:N-acetylneuraminate synthase n=1 Tax=Solimicrobium silvestre TaxID=2099400 RepID=A0A2S9GUU1_9BURK|nr:N-acetylneuraminate synthase [Solimicrobium silvestre]PRC91480.1 N-acetylneuraminate synthase [Solimicrobium silvestre]